MSCHNPDPASPAGTELPGGNPGESPPDASPTRHLRRIDRPHYTGPSMTPTMRAGDLLKVAPYGDQPILPGDVILFTPPGEKQAVTHRVISVSAAGVRARGDHNYCTDRWLLSASDIKGRVTHIRRGSRELPLLRGNAGLVYAAALRGRLRGGNFLRAAFRPFYLLIARIGIIRRMVRLKDLRFAAFARPGGTEVKLMLGRREIGRLLPGAARWNIEAPYLLLIDERALPTVWNKISESGNQGIPSLTRD